MEGWPGPSKHFDMRLLLKVVLLTLAVGALLLLGLHYPALFKVEMVLGALLALAVAVHVIFTVLRVHYANRWGATHSVPATVVRKWTEEAALDLSMEDESPAAWSLWVAFATESRKVDLKVPESVYADVEEGMHGVLTYRGERLLSFLPSDEAHEPDGPSRWRPGPNMPRV